MSVSKNYLYNLFYQTILILTPFITTPYIARVLGAEGIGIVAFTDSIVQYFIIMGTLGVNNLYGTRTIAYVRDNFDQRSKVFWELIIFKIITSIITYSVFIFCIFLVEPKYLTIFLIQSISIIASFFDVSWFFMALDDFKKTVTRNLIVRILGIIVLFIVVKTQSDLWKYVTLLVTVNLLGNIILCFYLPKYINFTKPDLRELKTHLMSSFKIFLPQTATLIYVILDKTMVGYLANQVELGIYDLSQKIIRVSLTVVTSTSIVLIPKISNVISKGDMEQMKAYIYKSFQFSSYLAIPLTLGLIGIAPEFIPWFLGDKFLKAITLITIAAPMIIAIAWSNVIGLQLMIPAKKEKALTISYTLAAIISFIVNLLLIPKLHSIGGAIGTLVAEIIVTATQFYFIRNFIPLKGLFFELWKILLASTLMFVAIKATGMIMGVGYLTTIVQIVLGQNIYTGTLLLLKSSTNQMVIDKLKAIILSKL